MIISIIAAIGKNRELGKDNKLLWHISEDMQRFKKLTTGHAVIMGRRTFESLGRPLPGRLNIIVSRNLHYEPVVINRLITTEVFGSLAEAIESLELRIKNKEIEEEVFIIGGGQIYEQAIKLANKLYLTIVEGDYEADTYFPDYSEFNKVVHKKSHQSEDYSYTFIDLMRQ